MNNTATNTATCPTVRKQIGKTTYIVRVHFSQTAKETMEDKIKRLLLSLIHIYRAEFLRVVQEAQSSQQTAEAVSYTHLESISILPNAKEFVISSYSITVLISSKAILLWLATIFFNSAPT